MIYIPISYRYIGYIQSIPAITSPPHVSKLPRLMTHDQSRMPVNGCKIALDLAIGLSTGLQIDPLKVNYLSPFVSAWYLLAMYCKHTLATRFILATYDVVW